MSARPPRGCSAVGGCPAVRSRCRRCCRHEEAALVAPASLSWSRECRSFSPRFHVCFAVFPLAFGRPPPRGDSMGWLSVLAVTPSADRTGRPRVAARASLRRGTMWIRHVDRRSWSRPSDLASQGRVGIDERFPRRTQFVADRPQRSAGDVVAAPALTLGVEKSPLRCGRSATNCVRRGNRSSIPTRP